MADGSAEILLKINTEFDDDGIQQAARALEKLINGAMGGASGKNLKGGFQQSNAAVKELNESLEALNQITEQVTSVTKGMNAAVKQAANNQKQLTDAQKQKAEELEKENKLLNENADLLTRVRRYTTQLTQEADKRAAAEKELADVTKEAQELEKKRLEVERKMQALIESGNDDRQQRKELERERATIDRQATSLINQRAAAEKKLNDVLETRTKASAARNELKHLIDWNEITDGSNQLVKAFNKIDATLEGTAKHGKTTMKAFSSALDGAGNEMIQFKEVMNGFGNVNLLNMLDKTDTQLEQLQSNMKQTRTTFDTAGEAITRQAKQMAEALETAQRESAQLESKTLKPTNMWSLKQNAATAQREAAQATKETNAALQRQQQVISAAQRMWTSLQKVVQNLAHTVAGVLLNALHRVSSILGSLTTTGGSRFAALRSTLDATGRSFLSFGDDAERGMSRVERAMARTAAGFGLMMAGQQMTQIGQQMFRNVQGSMNQWLGFEQASTLAAVATVNPNMPYLQERDWSPTRFIQELVFKAQRGEYSDNGERVTNLSSEDLAKAVYYYGSAIGQDITTENAGTIMRIITPIAQLAGFTQTQPETAVKGVLNAAEMFGFNPKDMRNAGNIQQITELYGFLANATSMEVPDIANFFKMVGPLTGILSPAGKGGALQETMAWAYIASEYGLRGSSPARGLQQLLQTVLSPSGPADAAAQSIWGMGIRDKFFDQETGTLKGGLKGIIEPFLDMDQGQWLVAQSDIFTTNASRTLIPLIESIRKDPSRWEDVLAELQNADFLSKGIGIASNTLTAALQDVRNAWDEFITSMVSSAQPQLFGWLTKLGGGIREVADIINGAPELGKFFTVMYAGIASVLAIGGGLITFAGMFLVLQRAMLMAGSGASTMLTIFRAIPAVLGMGLPILLALAAAALALKVAWDNNFLGMRDGITKVKDIFSGDFSKTFFSFLGSDQMNSVFKWTERLGRSFRELVAGVMFNTGDTDNLFALMNLVFGPRLGALVNQNLDGLRGKLTDLRSGIAGFFSDMKGGLPSLDTFRRATQGVLELLFTGGLSGGAARGVREIGDWLGIDGADGKLHRFISRFHAGFQQMSGVVVAFAAQFWGLIQQIGANIGTMFSGANLLAGLDFAFGVVKGFVGAIAGAAMLAVTAIERITAALASAGRAGAFVNDIIESLTGLRLTINDLGMLIGVVFGTLFASRILLAVTPIRLLISSFGQMGFALVGLTIKTALFAAQLAIIAARAAVIATVTAVFRTASASVALLTSATAGAGTAVGVLGKVFGVLSLQIFGVVGVLALVAVGIYAFVAATQGFDRANQLARAFFEGMKVGASWIVSALTVAAVAIAAVVKVVATIAQHLPIVSRAFKDGEAAAKTFGVALSMLAAIGVVAALAKMAMPLANLVTGFRTATKAVTAFFLAARSGSSANSAATAVQNVNTQLVQTNRNAVLARGALLGLTVIGAMGAFDPLISGLGKLIDKLLGVSSAGVSAGKVISGLLGGAAQGAMMGAMFGPQGAVIGGVLGAGLGAYNSYRQGKQAEKDQQQAQALQAVLRQTDLDLGSDVKMIPTVDALGVTVSDTNFASFEGTNPKTGMYGKYTVDLRNDNVFEYGQYLNPSYKPTDMQALNYNIPKATQDQYFKDLYNWQLSMYGADGSKWTSGWAEEWYTMSPDLKKANEAKGITTFDQFRNAKMWSLLAKDKPTFDATWAAEHPGMAVPTGPNIAGQADFNVMPDASMIAPSPTLPQPQGPNLPVLGQGTPMSAQEQRDKTAKAMWGDNSWGKMVSRAFGVLPTDMAAALGFTPEKGFRLDDLFNTKSLSKYAKDFDPQMLDFLPKEFKDYMKAQSEWDELQKIADERFKGDTNKAKQFYRDNGMKVPRKPHAFESFFGGSKEDAQQALELGAEEYEKFKTHEADVQSAWQQTDLPTAMQAVFSPSYMTKDGNLGRTVSGAEGLMKYSDQLLGVMGDAAPWMNQQEILADAGIQGLLTKNLGGVNMHNALRPVIEQWSAETGIAVEDYMAAIPKFFYDDKYMTQATTDLAQMFVGIPQKALTTLDTLGQGQFEEYGLKWQELTQFAVSQAMAGNTDWNLADYISQAWDMTLEDAEAYIAANGLNPEVINSAMFQDTQGMVNSMGGQVVALTTDWWTYLNEVTANGTDKTIEITQEAFNQLPDYVKMAYAQMGYQFVIGGEQNATQAAANAKMLDDRLTATYGEAFTNIKDELQKGWTEANIVTDEYGNRFVELVDEKTGQKFRVSEIDAEAYKKSWDTAIDFTGLAGGRLKTAVENALKDFRNAWNNADTWGEKGEATGGFLKNIGKGVLEAAKGGNESADVSSQLAMLGLPSIDTLDQYVIDATNVIRTGVATGLSTSTKDTAPIKVDLSAMLQLDEQTLSTFGSEVGGKIRDAIGKGLTSVAAPAGDGTGGPTPTTGASMAGMIDPLIRSIVDPLAQGLATQLPLKVSEAISVAMAGVGALLTAQNLMASIGVGDGAGAGIGTTLATSIGNSIKSALIEQLPAKVQEGLDAAMAQVSSLVSESAGSAGGESGLTFSATLDADVSPFGQKIGGATVIGETFAANTFTAQLWGDMTLFAAAISNATSAGDGFALKTFTAKLDGDEEPFLGAKNNAKWYGDEFAGTTFTAKIDADTSPFYAAVNSIIGMNLGTAYVSVQASVSGVSNAVGAIGSAISGMFGEHANGGYVRTPFQIVGERGPELVQLPYGSYVHTAQETERMMGFRQNGSVNTLSNSRGIPTTGGGSGSDRPIQINFNGPTYMTNKAEAKEIINAAVEKAKHEIARDQQLARRGMAATDMGRDFE